MRRSNEECLVVIAVCVTSTRSTASAMSVNLWSAVLRSPYAIQLELPLNLQGWAHKRPIR